MEQYALGLDFGTLSARAILVDIQTGEEKADAVYAYPHGVISKQLPDGTVLPPHFALADPEDYKKALIETIRCVVNNSHVPASQIVSIGIDATASTLIAVDQHNTPMCMVPGYQNHPHAYIKLWKHHGKSALEFSSLLESTARERKEPWYGRYGGRFNGEALMPKILETLREDSQLYDNTFTFLEVGDWLIRLLTHRQVRSKSMACCNCLYDDKKGFPSAEFFRQVHPAAGDVEEKLSGILIPLGKKAGNLSHDMAMILGLEEKTVVSSSMIDCHSAVPGCGMGQAGDLVMVLGTSSCFLLNDNQARSIPGIYSVAYEAHIPGLYGYEGGQSCVGDGFQYFIDHYASDDLIRNAQKAGKSVFTYIEEKAARLLPGESGLLAMDWWNGVRTPLLDYNLSGVILGMELSTPPEAIYRALVEASCFSARQIIELYRQSGCQVKRIMACGGLSQKNAMMMQILADVCQMPVAVSGSLQPCALGSAVMGAYAAGCGTFEQLLKQMTAPAAKVYMPNSQNVDCYEFLYQEYLKMFYYFSQENRLTERLHLLRQQQLSCRKN